jgi:hypothetical protein
MTASEAFVKDYYTKHGWRAINGGLIDFVLTSPNQIKFAEVKSGSDSLSQKQWDALIAMESAKIDSVVAMVFCPEVYSSHFASRIKKYSDNGSVCKHCVIHELRPSDIARKPFEMVIDTPINLKLAKAVGRLLKISASQIDRANVDHTFADKMVAKSSDKDYLNSIRSKLLKDSERNTWLS